ncbi:alpha/beta fold hydrolase [Streptomyces sp. NPDC057424]|uniref:alpha/beta fold hydrolase n=1 Tax=Streptomyces sp. NPDC057424 TaxID=3346127 RepID=UPI00368111DE
MVGPRGEHHRAHAADRWRAEQPDPQERIAAFAELLPGARHISVDAGHLVHEARPREFLAAVEGFLSPADRTPS